MSNKSSSVFGGSHGRWEFGNSQNQTIMASHKPKEVSVPVPDSTVSMTVETEQSENPKELSVTSSADLAQKVPDVVIVGEPVVVPE